MEKEPAAIVAFIVGLAGALLTLLVVFGLDLTDDQVKAILGVVSFIAPVVAGLVIRSKVFAPATVKRLVPSTRLRVDPAAPLE